MPTSNKMFVEQSHSTMPPSVWLHVNGVSLTTDIHQYQPPVHTYDYRTKHLQSPVRTPTPPLISSPTVVPCSITMIDRPYNNNNNMNKQYQKLDNIDLPKKIFIDRHIKKAKSLPGLIKGTALSRHTPLHSSTFVSPAPTNPLTIKIQDDQLPNVTIDNDDDNSLPLSQTLIQQSDIRRPRVYFADFNKVKIIEDNNNETSQQHHIKRRHHRHRTTKKTSIANGINYTSPSIQQPQTLHNSSLPLSYHQIGQESNIKKQQSLLTHRTNSSHSIYLPEILNQSLLNETSLNDNSNGKYILQREKPLNYFSKTNHDIPSNSSMDISSDITHTDGNTHSSSIHDSHNRTHDSEAIDSSNGMLHLTSSSISSTSTNRQRSLLHTISLRQQFHTPIKIKATGISSTTTTTNNNNNNNNNQQQQINNSKLNTHRSISFKNSTSKNSDDNDDLNKSSLPIDNRPITANGSIKQLKRSDVIHFNSKNPFGNNTTNDLNEINRHTNKLNIHEINQERFRNVLTIVRPPYVTTSNTSSNMSSTFTHNDSITQTNNHNQIKRNIRSSRSTSARGSVGLHIASNTIIV